MEDNIFSVKLNKLTKSVDVHPCYVLVTSKSANLVCRTSRRIQEPYKSFVGALYREKDEIIDYSKPNLYVNVLVDDSSDLSSGDTNCLCLYVTDVFLNIYNFSLEQHLYFKHVYCLPLEKVVLGARESSFLSLQQDEVSNQLITSVCEREVLCRTGDVLQVFNSSVIPENSKQSLLDIVALQCYPVNQGVLTVNTSFIVTRITEDISRIKDYSHRIDNYVISKENYQLSPHLVHILKLCNYTGRLVLPFASNEKAAALGSVTGKIIKELHNKFRIEIIPKPSVLRIKYLKQCDLDPINIIYITRSALQRLELKERNWVRISLVPARKRSLNRSISNPNISKSLDPSAGEDAKRKQNSEDLNLQSRKSHRMAVVCCEDNESCKELDSALNQSVDDIVQVSPLLWFNLNAHPSNLLQPNAQLIIQEADEVCDIPPYAVEVSVTLVQSPHYSLSANCDSLLKSYFKIPRYIHQDDIFCIGSRDDPLFHQTLDPAFSRWPVVYFRVSFIKGPPSETGYIVDTTHSRLYQSGTTRSCIPITMETYYASGPLHPVWDVPIPPGIGHYTERLQKLIIPFLKSKHSRNQVSSNILLTGDVCCGKTTIVKALCRCLNLHLYQVNCHELSGDSSGFVEGRVKASLMEALKFVPCILLLKNIDCIGKGKEVGGEDPRVLNAFSETLKCINFTCGDWPVIAIATTSHPKKLSGEILSSFLHQINIETLDEREREDVIRDLLSTFNRGNDISVEFLAQRTAGFVLGDLVMLISLATRSAYTRIKPLLLKYNVSIEEEEDICHAGIPIFQQDLVNALEKLQSVHAQAIGAPKIPNVQWEDVGGLAEVKQEILDTIQVPLQYPELLLSGLRRSGVLLYGPPGTGKTLLAKAVATECSLNFLSVKGPELINMYVGQSEENVREVFQRARSAVPCIIFFDELDSLAPNRGRSGDSGGVMDRVVSQLLAELDGINKSAELFVIGATNRPDLIDPALLRPGRFDRLLYVGIAEDKDSRLKIIEALTRKFNMAEDLDLEDIVNKCPPGLTGADFYSLCSNAMINSIGQAVELIEQGSLKAEDAKPVVCKENFETALKSLVPSVSAFELQRFQKIKISLSN